jgi:large subunit ribosomal protein L4
MPRKMRRAAVRCALSAKAASERIVVLQEFAMAEPKTREMAAALERLAVRSSALILMVAEDLAVQRSANNLAGVKLLRANYVNVRDLLNYDYVVIPQAALAVIEQVLG